MLIRALLVLAALLLGFAAFDSGMAQEKKDNGTKQERTDPQKIKGAVIGKIKTVDVDNSSFTISPDKGKDRTFKVNDKTQFMGPLGGKGEGLKDDRMEKGNVVVVIPTADGKTAKEVHLPYRKKEKDEKKKDKG